MNCLETFREDFLIKNQRLPTAEEEDEYEDWVCYNEYELHFPLCMTCGVGDELLINNMYCFDCHKRQQFLHIFSESSTYCVGSYFGKHLLERYLGYYVSEDDFIAFMKKHDYKFNEKKLLFKTKINKKKAFEILGEKI
jgi:hypothetical protein